MNADEAKSPATASDQQGPRGSAALFQSRYVTWAVLFGYLVSFFVPALLRHFFEADSSWDFRVQMWVWYSLAGAASAAACWIALGDGRLAVRLFLASWALVWIWIVWQAATYVAFLGIVGDPSSSTDGFSYYAIGHAVFAFAITLLMLCPMRALFGMRLTRGADRGSLVSIPSRFTISQLMCAIAIIGVTLGVAKMVAPTDLGYLGFFTTTTGNAEFALFTVYYLTMVLPSSLAMVFYPRWIHFALLYFLVAAIAVTLLEHGRSALLHFDFRLTQTANYAAAIMAQIVAMLLVLRCLGYRLTWGKRRNQARSSL